MSKTPLPEFRADRGTAARSGASDLAQFAAAPLAFAGTSAEANLAHVAIHPAEPGTGESAGKSSSVVHEIGGGGDLKLSPAASVARGSSNHDNHILSTQPAAVPAPPAPPAHGSDIATYVPAPHHEFVPPGTTAATVSNDESASHGAGAAFAPAGVMPGAADVAHALDTIRTSAQTLTGAIAALNDHLLPQLGAVDQQVADTIDQAQAIVDATLDHVGDLGAALGTTVSGAGAEIDHVVAAAGSNVSTVLDQTSQVAGDTISHVTDTAGDLTHGIGSTISALSDTLLHDGAVGGSDPVGGITTLVGMVSAADMFHVHDDGPGASDMGFAPALGVAGAADLLADVAPSSILLGVTDHHGGLGDALHDDHGHLLGLG